MSNLQELLALANEAAEISNIDMSETSKGGGAKRLLPAGKAIATLVEYIELGKHLGEYNGKPKSKPDALFRLGFALSSPAAYLNEDGTPYIFRTFDLSLGNNEKSKAKIAFDRMNYLQTAKHFAQLLGKSFIVEIKIVKGKTDPTKERNEIVWATIDKPFEAMSGAPYPTPDLNTLPFRLFLWDKPTKEGWDSLHIDGVGDDGKSRNYIQNTCKAAVDFPGSALEQLIGGGIPDLTQPTLTPTTTIAAPAQLAPAGLATPVAPVVTPSLSDPLAPPFVVSLPDVPQIPGLS